MNQSGPNRPNWTAWTKVDRIGQNGPNRTKLTKVDRMDIDRLK